MSDVFKSLIKTSGNPMVVFSLEAPICNFSMRLRTLEGKVSIETEASKSKSFSVMERLNPPNRILLTENRNQLTAATVSTQRIKLVNCIFSN